jgi:hypothetical protein
MPPLAPAAWRNAARQVQRYTGTRACLQSRHLVDLAGVLPAGVELVMRALHAVLTPTVAPLADGHARQPDPPGNGGVGFSGCAGQAEKQRNQRTTKQAPRWSSQDAPRMVEFSQ